MLIRAIKIFFASLLFLPSLALAADLDSGMAQAAKALAITQLKGHSEKAILIQVVNLHNQKTDQTAKTIETALYQALEKEFPGFKLVFLSESIAGTNLLKAIIVKGEYEQKGPITKAHFKAIIGLQGESVGQASVEFESVKTVRKSLVAVLDLEAAQLSGAERSLYSDMLREELGKKKAFEMASSADVAKMNPDAIQKSYGCSRDECATIIGEQMGVDQVISTTYFSVGAKAALSGKLFNIKDGSIVTTATVQGAPTEIQSLIKELATKLTGVEEGGGVSVFGQFKVDSDPSGATLFLDGKTRDEKTPAVLSDIPAGSHTLRLIKDDLGAVLTFDLADGEVKKLSAQLSNEAALTVTSTPFDAELWVDGAKVGNTPFQGNAKTGLRELTLKFPDGSKFRHQVQVELEGENKFEFKQKELVQARLTIQPADALLKAEGKEVGGKAPETFTSKDEKREVWLAMPQGTYQFELSHPHQTNSVTANNSLNIGNKVEMEFSVPLKQGYMDWQDYHAAVEHRSFMITWTLLGAAVTSGYAYVESQNAVKAQTAQSEAETNRDAAFTNYKAATDTTTSATYLAESQAYHQTAIDENQKVKSHNANVQAGSGLTALILLATTWYWLADPDEPPAYGLISTQDGLKITWGAAW